MILLLMSLPAAAGETPPETPEKTVALPAKETPPAQKSGQDGEPQAGTDEKPEAKPEKSFSLEQFGAAGRILLQPPPGARGVGVATLYAPFMRDMNDDTMLVATAERLLPFAILQRGPGDFLRVAFPAAGETPVLLLHGVPPERMPPKTVKGWHPPGGLLLTTYPFKGGDAADTFERMKKVVEDCRAERKPYGRGFVPNVYHGYHAFSSAEKFVSVYEGYLHCPRGGEYVIATSSDDASFLLIDEQEVISWPGGHGAVADSRFRETIQLSKGRHRFAYWHLNFGGPTVAVAAWQPPGAKKVVPIPPGAFGKVARYAPRLDGIAVENAGEAWVDGHQLLRYRFAWPATANAVGAGTWHFDDDTTAVGQAVEHIYLRPGLRTIRFVGKQGDTPCDVSLRVMVEPDYSRQIERKLDDPKPYLDALAAYPFDKLNEDDLRLAMRVLSEGEGYDRAVVDACRAALAREDFDRGLAGKLTLLLGERLRDALGRPDEAIAVFREGLTRKLSRKADAEITKELGDTLFFFSKDPDAALNEYDKVVGRYAEVLEDNVVRLTKLRIGDIYRQKGQGGRARKAYADAAALMLYERTFAQHAVRKGALYKAAEDYLAQGDFDAALQWLDILEWEYPLEKMDGSSSLLRARVAAASGNRPEAIKQLRWFIAASPKSAYAAEALYRLAQIHLDAGDDAAAGKALATLKRDYPDSPFALKGPE